jgi:hypothetical protein
MGGGIKGNYLTDPTLKMEAEVLPKQHAKQETVTAIGDFRSETAGAEQCVTLSDIYRPALGWRATRTFGNVTAPYIGRCRVGHVFGVQLLHFVGGGKTGRVLGWD